jgi:hypothetical protein
MVMCCNELCFRRASFGVPGGSPKYCEAHCAAGMIDVKEERRQRVAREELKAKCARHIRLLASLGLITPDNVGSM